MAEKNEYFTQKLENGTLQISEDVVASVAAAAVLEVEGVCGLSSSISTRSMPMPKPTACSDGPPSSSTRLS